MRGTEILSDYGIPIWLKMTQGSQLKISENGRGIISGYPSTEALKTTLGGKEETRVACTAYLRLLSFDFRHCLGRFFLLLLVW